LKTLNDAPLLRDAAREYVHRQEERLKPQQDRLASLIAEHAEAERNADEYVKLAGRAGVSSQLLAKYEREAEKELLRAAQCANDIKKLESKLEQVVRYSESEIERVVEQVQTKLVNGTPTFAQKLNLVEWANVVGRLDGEQVKFQMQIGLTFTVDRSVSPSSRFSPTCRATRPSD
jgi:hypothetical protein